MNSEKDTLPNNEAILNAILELGNKIDSVEQRLNTKIDSVEQRLNSKIDALQQDVDSRFEEMRLQMMSFDVRIDRIEALTHEVLNVAYNARADVKVLREEVHSWSKEVRNLQLKFA